MPSKRLVNGSRLGKHNKKKYLMNGDEPRYGFDEVVKIFQDIVHNARMSVIRSCRQLAAKVFSLLAGGRAARLNGYYSE
ncbi:hypothetical protein JG687_00009750 [Phytophthora cactorum]|uniref:Uncharacterized protein n=1 Tax=Phytophthora cactorum TaxID=29920 RepID=A0A8T1UBB7_9STRA|nr:hypothetical protein JG687_00009750 [Phytophthora cactorum]